jgi:hypothetical protein
MRKRQKFGPASRSERLTKETRIRGLIHVGRIRVLEGDPELQGK